jgi:hypothetical protein
MLSLQCAHRNQPVTTPCDAQVAKQNASEGVDASLTLEASILARVDFV